MSEELVTIPLELQLPLKTVQDIVRSYLLAQFAQRPTPNGAHPTVQPTEGSAPAVASPTGAP